MPVLFTVGDFTIRTYLLCIILAIFTAVALIRFYEIPRLIWFRITPTMADVFEFTVFGYQVDGEPEADRVSNVLTLQVEVRP